MSDTEVSAPPRGLADGIRRVLSDYAAASQEPFEKHELAKLIRGDLADAVEATVGDPTGTYLVKGSAGQGVWARGPWVAIFNRLVTTSAQSGYYVCLLFREDMQGVYLTLVQAMTEAKRHYRSNVKASLRARAANFRALLGKVPQGLPLETIDLMPSTQQNDTSFYEAGVIAAKYYPKLSLPDDDELSRDIRSALTLYEMLISSETNDVPTSIVDTQVEPQFEDSGRKKLHYRIERNKKLANDVKEALGFTCQACGFNFEEAYGELGKGFIEAHHLTPISTLVPGKVQLDPRQDFAVLCSNCHSMIHRSEFVSDIAAFRDRHLKLPP
ncbi:DUF3578 domain-containing protein [Luteibacter aegosomaticola]|uniref:MrcB family domain-containing protein n=1 Tax=Luteibacter aegosomaticola TaxID=2911538 RepID=UPI001FF75C5A|nr:DUF3578 domain-containing protein [Luteibacter aegosomaticola]UPG89503.1 DUF3578 domain-containing protein [Luteibacter aegosomaticola]